MPKNKSCSPPSLEEEPLLFPQTSASKNTCSPDDADAQIERYLALHKRSQAMIDDVYKVTSPFVAKLRALHSPIERVKNLLEPLENQVEKIKNEIEKFENSIKPVLSVLKEIEKVMDERYCVKVKVKVGALKVGDKFCFRIEKMVKDVQKEIDAIQKPVNEILKKALDPLVNKLMKVLPDLKIQQLKEIYKKLDSIESTINDFQQMIESFTSNPFEIFDTKFQSIANSLKELNK